MTVHRNSKNEAHHYMPLTWLSFSPADLLGCFCLPATFEAATAVAGLALALGGGDDNEVGSRALDEVERRGVIGPLALKVLPGFPGLSGG